MHGKEGKEDGEGSGGRSRRGRGQEEEERGRREEAPPPPATAIAWHSDKYFGTPLQVVRGVGVLGVKRIKRM